MSLDVVTSFCRSGSRFGAATVDSISVPVVNSTLGVAVVDSKGEFSFSGRYRKFTGSLALFNSNYVMVGQKISRSDMFQEHLAAESFHERKRRAYSFRSDGSYDVVEADDAAIGGRSTVACTCGALLLVCSS